MYAQGIGVAQDNATALEYFRKGAAKGHPPSQNGLGYMYMHGYGVSQNYKKALEYFKAAAEKGIPLGLVRVATLDGVRALLTLAMLPTISFLTIAVQSTAPPTLARITLTHPTHTLTGAPPLRLPPPTPPPPAVGEADALR